MKAYLFTILAVALTFTTQAQGWQLYNTQNSGLPDNTVYQVAIAPNGTKWIATNNGLARFDGSNWTVFTTANGLPDNSIRSVFVDPNGIVWAGTFTGGIAKYNGTGFTTYSTNNSNLPDNFVRNFAFEAPNTLWIVTGGGPAKLKNDTITGFDLSMQGLESNSTASVAVKANGIKVIGLINGGFAYYNDTTFTFYTHSNSSLPDNTVLSISLDAQDNPYMAMPDGGIIAHFGGNIWQVYNAVIIPAMTTNSYHCILKDSLGQGFWAGSFENGIVRYNGGANWETFSTGNSAIPDNHILHLAKEGSILWVATENNGLAAFDITSGINETTIDPSIQTYIGQSGLTVSANNKLQAVQVFSTDGRLLAEQTHIEANTTTLPLQAEQGMVIVRCISSKGVMAKRLWAN